MKFIWILLVPCIAANNVTHDFTKVFVEKIFFTSLMVEKFIRDGSDLRNIQNTTALLDEESENIKIYCRIGFNKVLYSNIEVSPQYKNKTEALDCYTRLSPDKAFGATATANNPSRVRVPSHLVNGINYLDHNSCAETGGLGHPWFLIDLHKVVEVTRVVVTTHTFGYLSALPGLMKIKYAEDSPDDEEFITWKEYQGSDMDSGKNLEFTADVPFRARYFLFQKFKSGQFTKFMLCNVQIF